MIGRTTPKVTRKTIMPFGKHKGLSIGTILDIDPGYIEWLVEDEVMNIPDDIYNEAQESNFQETDGWDGWLDE